MSEAVGRTLTRRERRRRLLLVIALVILLGLLAYALYYFQMNKKLPLPGLGTPDEVLAPPRYLYSITGAGANVLDDPVGVAVAPNGRVYAVDFGKRRISAFTTSGRFLFAFNEVNDGRFKKLGNPVHLQVRDDEVWVTDRRQRAIYVYDMDGKFKRTFRPKDAKKLEWTPLALGFDKDGNPRVTDVGNSTKHRLVYYSEDGSRTAMVGSTIQVTKPDAAPAGFFFPNGIAVSDDGLVFVSDGDNRRVQVFDDKGEFKYFVNTSGVPRGVAIDDNQRLYVVDAVAHSIDIYDLKGEKLTTFGSQGFGPGQFNFPNDVALSSNSQRIFITDRDNDQVQVWGWPVAEPPRVAAPTEPWQWGLCLAPLLLLPLLLLLRRRRYVVTPDFVEVMVSMDRADVFDARRTRFACPEFDASRYAGRIENGIDLGKLIEPEPFSESDVRQLVEKLQIPTETAAYIAMSERARALLTDDSETRRLARMADVRVLNSEEYLEKEYRGPAKTTEREGNS